jgi:uncharacterized protein
MLALFRQPRLVDNQPRVATANHPVSFGKQSLMIDPTKVLGFLDLAGAWDPSLAFVMGGATVVAFVGFRIAGRRRAALSREPFHLPDAGKIDGRLIGGSVLFGIGWGLVGLCPGPALVDLGFLDGRAALFVIAMIAGAASGRAFPALSAADAPSPAFSDG